MKGYLKSPQGLFPLAPKVTTIGREGCDLVIPWSSVDQQHALLEYLPEEECFVLQDLNSVHGTYVNDCRVENVSIRLCPGDIIRFGKSSMKHELIVEQQQQQQRVSYLPLMTQNAWAQPLALLQDETPHSDSVYSRGLPHLKSITSTTTQFALSPSAVTALPRPPRSLKSRPLSAGSRQQFSDRTPAVGSQKTSSKASGWGSGRPGGLLRSSSSSDLFALQEKEQRQLYLEEEMCRLEEEMQRLSHYEIECHRKDAVVDRLYKEISQLQQRLRTAEACQNSHQMQETDVTQKLRILEREVAAKKEEVNILRNKINAMQKGNDSGNLTYRADDITEVQRLRNELSQANNERKAANEYIRNLEGQLLLLKSNNLQSLEKDFDNLIAQLRDKENEVREFKEKLDKVKGINEELKDKSEKIAVLEKLLKEAETAKEQQSIKMVSLISDLAEKEKTCDDRVQEIQDLQKQLEEEKTKTVELTEENSAKQTEIANLSTKLDHLRINLGQICPDLTPDASNVVEVVATFNMIREECCTYQKEIEKLKTKVIEVDELSSGYETLKSDLSEVLATLGTNGCFSRELKLEAAAIQSKSYASQLHNEIKDLFIHLLEIQLRWEDEIEDAFEGDKEYDPKTSSTGPGKWIAETLKKLSAVEQEVRSLRSKLDETDELHKIDLEVALDALRDDLMKKFEDQLEKVKLDSDEIQAIESRKRDESIAAERTRKNEIEAKVEHLKLEINKKEEELRENSDKAKRAEEEIEVYKQTEIKLRQKVVELENQNTDVAERFAREIDEKAKVHEDEVNEYKEQIRQHALTICAMEERLNLAATRHKEFQSEITVLKSEITALQSRPQQVNESTFHTNLQSNHPGHHHSTPPQTLSPSPPQTQHPTPSLKPRIVLHAAVPDGTLLQQTLAQAQKENADYLKQVQEQQDCIFALRRDLAGATARLTDVSGELSEAQKQEIEQFRVKIKEQESEIISLQQQLAKLSDIIDKQTAEIKGLNVEASKQKVIIGKYKNRVKEKEAKLNEAETEISKAKSELSQKMSVLDNETAVTSQLTLMGAQCRGERHEQVIARQTGALSELRAKLRAMEQGDIPLLSQNEAVQEVAILRNQLEELRSLQAAAQQRPTEWGMFSDLPNHQQFIDSRYGPNPVNRQGPMDPAFGDGVVANHLDATQHSTFREVSEAFELSENLYLSLLRGIASSLELDRIGGIRSLLNVPRDERMRLAKERQHACEELTDTIKALRERVYRKDELLQGYEKDLAKLRHAENLTEMTSGQVQNVMTELRKKTEEVQCLRESLHRTKDRLEQEKRLNMAIKNKKTFHLEHEPVSKNGWPKHHCIQPDAHVESHAKRKQQNERKRRQYEKELKAKEADIAMHRKFLAEQDNRILDIS